MKHQIKAKQLKKNPGDKRNLKDEEIEKVAGGRGDTSDGSLLVKPGSRPR